jgi:hypothetical protein
MAEKKTIRKQMLSDFATIFAHMWYRDFPLQQGVREKAQRADWTTHIGVAVRSTADLMGLFTHFESGRRTDAVLRDNMGSVVAALEWEWAALHRGDTIVNEFNKLQERCGAEDFKGVQFAGLIAYARESSAKGRSDYTERWNAVLEDYTVRWHKALPPLLLVAVHFQWQGKPIGRQFTTMTIDEIAGGKRDRIREQQAYPWDVCGSRWTQETENGS